MTDDEDQRGLLDETSTESVKDLEEGQDHYVEGGDVEEDQGENKHEGTQADEPENTEFSSLISGSATEEMTSLRTEILQTLKDSTTVWIDDVLEEKLPNLLPAILATVQSNSQSGAESGEHSSTINSQDNSSTSTIQSNPQTGAEPGDNSSTTDSQDNSSTSTSTNKDTYPLDRDAFAIMMISEPFISKGWCLGAVSFFIEMTLGIIIAIKQFDQLLNDYDISYKIDVALLIGQALAFIIGLSTQTDFLAPIESLHHWGPGSKWNERITEKQKNTANVPTDRRHVETPESTKSWAMRIFLPNALKCTQGALVWIVSFILILLSKDVIELLKDFTALTVVSQTDNALFYLAEHGFLGEELENRAKQVNRICDDGQSESMEETEEESAASTNDKSHSRRSLVIIITIIAMIICWIYLLKVNLVDGTFYKLKFPHCKASFELAKKHFGDGKCWGGDLNSIECGFEGGDCVQFNLAFPLCNNPAWVDVEKNLLDSRGDFRSCNETFNNHECLFDNYACCDENIVRRSSFGNNKCEENVGVGANTALCYFDDGDCDQYNEQYCDKNNKTVCCPLDIFNHPNFGNEICEDNVGVGANTALCHFDDGDCLDYNKNYCNENNKTDCCPLDIFNGQDFGNGICEGRDNFGVGANTALCRFDDGDCDLCDPITGDCCSAMYSLSFANGICDTEYNVVPNTALCGFEGGDCLEFNFDFYKQNYCNDYSETGCCPWEIFNTANFKNTVCEDDFNVGANTALCGFDGGDCAIYNEHYYLENYCDKNNKTDCCPLDIFYGPNFGNKKCEDNVNVGANTALCRFDDGDCLKYNTQYCNENKTECCPLEILNGTNFRNEVCEDAFNVGANTALCGFDGGDCDVYNDMFCNSDKSECCPRNITNSSSFGDNKCDAAFNISPNTALCRFDDGDCLKYNTQYCNEDKTDCCPFEIFNGTKFRNGFCEDAFNTGANTALCRFDGGDCDVYNADFCNSDKSECCPLNITESLDRECDQYWNFPLCQFDNFNCVEENMEKCRNEGESSGFCVCPYEVQDPLSEQILDNGECQAKANTKSCKFDMEDCRQFNGYYKKCVDFIEEKKDLVRRRKSDIIFGNGICEGGSMFNVDICGHEFDDCSDGQVRQDLQIIRITESSMQTQFLRVSEDGGTVAVQLLQTGRGAPIQSFKFNGDTEEWLEIDNGVETITNSTSFELNRDGTLLAVLDNLVNQIHIYEYTIEDETWNDRNKLAFEVGTMVESFDMSADGLTFAIATIETDRRRRIAIYDIKYSLSQPIFETPNELDVSRYFHLSSDGSKLLLGVSSENSTVYNATSNGSWTQLENDIPSRLESLESSAISRDGSRVIIASNVKNPGAPGEVQVFDIIDGDWVRGGDTIYSQSSERGDGFGDSIAISEDGKLIAVATATMDATAPAQLFVESDLYCRRKFLPISKRPGDIQISATRIHGLHFLTLTGNEDDRTLLSVTSPNERKKDEVLKVYDLDKLVLFDFPYVEPGLRVRYYNGVNKISTRLKDQGHQQRNWEILKFNSINFPSTDGAFATLARSDYFAAWFEGYVDFYTDGIYDIDISSDNEARIYINDMLVLRNSHATNPKSQKIIVSESGFKKVSVEFREKTGIARLILSWKPPGKSKFSDVPFFNLYRNGALVEDTLSYSYHLYRASFLKVKYYHDLNNLNNRLEEQGKKPDDEQVLSFNTINFPQTDGKFATSDLENRVFAWFEGYVDFSEVGNYVISADCDDSVALYINDKKIGIRGSPGVLSYSLTIHTGETGLKKVSVEFGENTGAARLVLRWKTPSSSSQQLMTFAYAEEKDICTVETRTVSGSHPELTN